MICELILICSLKYNLNPKFLTAIIKHESNMNPLAVNGQARIQSFGLGQLTERTARKVCGLQQKDIFDMSKNIDCAAKHLSSQVKRYNGDLDKAASSYNAGHFTQHNKKYVRLVRANLARNFCKIP